MFRGLGSHVDWKLVVKDCYLVRNCSHLQRKRVNARSSSFASVISVLGRAAALQQTQHTAK